MRVGPTLVFNIRHTKSTDPQLDKFTYYGCVNLPCSTGLLTDMDMNYACTLLDHFSELIHNLLV